MCGWIEIELYILAFKKSMDERFDILNVT